VILDSNTVGTGTWWQRPPPKDLSHLENSTDARALRLSTSSMDTHADAARPSQSGTNESAT